MEVRLRFRVTNSSPVTAVVYHPLRREIITGHEDGLLKCWEADTGRLSTSLRKHQGWVTNLLYWAEGKVLFSSSVDGSIIQWSQTGAAFNTVETSAPVFSLTWCLRRNALIAGDGKGKIGIIHIAGRHSLSGHSILDHKVHPIPSHDDIVSCLVAVDNKLYSAGYDKKLIIHEIASPNINTQILRQVFVKRSAHDAGITKLELTKTNDGTSWIFTGSFDWHAKIWTVDGKLIHSLQFVQVVTGLCYVPDTQTLWVAAGTDKPVHFEPRSGDNVTEYIDQAPYNQERESQSSRCLQHLCYVPDLNEVIGMTSSREVTVWRYSNSSTVCCQQLETPIETLTFTKKVPILIYCGTSNGQMMKLERLQLNHFMYSTEKFLYKEDFRKHLNSDDGERNLAFFLPGKNRASDEELGEVEKEKAKMEVVKKTWRGFVSSLYVESLDLLVASCQDGRVFIWGFDKKSAKVLRETQRAYHEDNDEETEEDLLTFSRVAGMIMKCILNRHDGSVPGLALAEGSSTTDAACLLTAGWDLRICIWELETGTLAVQINDSIPPSDAKGHSELLLTDIAYCPNNDIFAYSASNGNVYLRKFSTRRSEVQLLATLHGTRGEITKVCWNTRYMQWVTGSETGAISLWSADGSVCEASITTPNPVSVLCIDSSNGAIVTGMQDTIRVYNDKLDVVQVNKGHTDIIRSIIHIPDRNQYVSASWDGSMRIWNAYQPKAIHS